MIRINFAEPDTDDWRDWKAKCEVEQNKYNKAIESGVNAELKTQLYKEQKQIYINPNGAFHGKCAYCETNIYTNQHGDIEHYRPKRAVKDENDKPIIVTVNGKTKEHPGYYWLAYTWTNLLPSCSLCNGSSTQHSSGELIGKRNQFPVKDFRAVKPGEEIKEQPLLLNPMFDEASEHLELDELGIFYPKNNSERGKTCIEIFGLNYRDLPNARRQVYESIKDKMSILAQSLVRNPNSQDTKERLQKIIRIKKGSEEYTVAARKAIRDSCYNLGPMFQVVLDSP